MTPSLFISSAFPFSNSSAITAWAGGLSEDSFSLATSLSLYCSIKALYLLWKVCTYSASRILSVKTSGWKEGSFKDSGKAGLAMFVSEDEDKEAMGDA